MTPPRITSWGELDATLLKRMTDYSADYLDGEVAQSIGRDARQRSLGKVAELADVRVAIAWIVEQERQATDGR